jgi:serine protease Do
MKVWTTAAATLTLLIGLAIGTAVAPVRGAQKETIGEPKETIWEPAVVQLLGGGGRLGVSVRETDAEEARRAKQTGGVVIEDVREESPAAKAGFKAGDIVVEFDGERVRSTRQFTRLVQETPVERQVQAVVVRDGQRVTLSVQTEGSDSFAYFRDFGRGNALKVVPPRPPAPPAVPKPPALDMFPRLEQYFSYSSSGRLGITVDSLSTQLAEYFGTKDGVLVTSVSSDSAAAKAGLKAGDVITAIDGTAVDSVDDLSRRTQRLNSGAEFTLEIVRDKKPMTLKGKLEPRTPRRVTV